MQATISAKSGGQATCVREKTNWALIIIRILTAFAGLMIFFPEVNPGPYLVAVHKGLLRASAGFGRNRRLHGIPSFLSS